MGGAARAVGIEMNKELCEVQNAAVAAFQSTLAAASSSSSSSPSPPITIIQANVSTALSTLHEADVVVCKPSNAHLISKSQFPAKNSKPHFGFKMTRNKVLHNVFQFFHAPAEARKLWQQV
jgi:hypothetical protein